VLPDTMSNSMLNVTSHSHYTPGSPIDSGYDSTSPVRTPRTPTRISNSPCDSTYGSYISPKKKPDVKEKVHDLSGNFLTAEIGDFSLMK
jgi:hypothetical protein